MYGIHTRIYTEQIHCFSYALISQLNHHIITEELRFKHIAMKTKKIKINKYAGKKGLLFGGNMSVC